MCVDAPELWVSCMAGEKLVLDTFWGMVVEHPRGVLLSKKTQQNDNRPIQSIAIGL